MCSIEDGKVRFWTGTYHYLVDPAVNNQWYHLRFDFETSDGGYMGLSEDSCYVYVDGVQFGPFTFDSSLSQLDRFYFFTGYGATTNAYFDAFGFSWDNNYNIGDNLNEGLLFSFENYTNIETYKYSID